MRGALSSINSAYHAREHGLALQYQRRVPVSSINLSSVISKSLHGSFIIDVGIKIQCDLSLIENYVCLI